MQVNHNRFSNHLATSGTALMLIAIIVIFILNFTSQDERETLSNKKQIISQLGNSLQSKSLSLTILSREIFFTNNASLLPRYKKESENYNSIGTSAYQVNQDTLLNEHEVKTSTNFQYVLHTEEKKLIEQLKLSRREAFIIETTAFQLLESALSSGIQKEKSPTLFLSDANQQTSLLYSAPYLAALRHHDALIQQFINTSQHAIDLQLQKKDDKIRFYKNILFLLLTCALIIQLAAILYTVYFKKQFTARRDVELESLKESYTLLKDVFDSIPYKIFLKDEQGRIKLVNKEVAKHYPGHTTETLKGTTDEEHFGKQGIAWWRSELEIIHSGKLKVINEDKVLENDGSITIFRSIKMPFLIASTNTVGILGVQIETNADAGQVSLIFSRDIKLRKAYQKKVLQSEANLRSIFDAIEDGISLLSSNFHLLDFNEGFSKQFEQQYGLRPSKGKSILELIPETSGESRSVWELRYRMALEGKPGKYYHSYLVDQEMRIDETKLYPIVEKEKVIGLTIYSRDITREKNAEDVLTAQNTELTKINSELDRFVYSTSHDIRAPLMSIKGILNLMNQECDKGNEKFYLSLIGKSIERLDNFIHEIMDYSKNSRMDIVLDEINFNVLIQESLDSLKFIDGANEMICSKKVQTSCPFYCDYRRLLIVFNNIIGNSIKYRDTQKEVCHLTISINCDEALATLEFSDNGVGIAPEYLDKIFKMFFRANSESKGSGLGLYIVQGVIEKIGGTIEVSSAEGEGTTFKIRVPNLKRKTMEAAALTNELNT